MRKKPTSQPPAYKCCQKCEKLEKLDEERHERYTRNYNRHGTGEAVEHVRQRQAGQSSL